MNLRPEEQGQGSFLEILAALVAGPSEGDDLEVGAAEAVALFVEMEPITPACNGLTVDADIDADVVVAVAAAACDLAIVSLLCFNNKRVNISALNTDSIADAGEALALALDEFEFEGELAGGAL